MGNSGNREKNSLFFFRKFPEIGGRISYFFFGNSGNWGKIPYFFKGNSGNLGKKSVIFLYFRNSKAHGCQGSGSTLGLSRKQLAHELREGSGALRDETHPADSNFLQTETRERQMSIDVHPSLRRCLEKKSNSQDHRNEKTRSRRYEKL